MPDLPEHYELPSPRAAWLWDRSTLEQWQLEQLNRQLQAILPANRFYRDKFARDTLQLKSLAELAALPLTSKLELVKSVDAQGLSRHQTFEMSRYARMHRTSGTTGTPLLVCDTAEDWSGWWSATWQNVLEAADVNEADRVFLAFSFGPFVGFWSAHQACVDRGAMVFQVADYRRLHVWSSCVNRRPPWSFARLRMHCI